ncbi:Motile sperm domain-containing protein 1 [Lamellibrachia satsuma]|nr:Motile sperm domain-containing protein 1 [Lamellibrachia satsuma]
MQAASFGDGKLPVFVFPTSLVIFADDQSTHRQVLTLYNPYEFNLKFKVLCTVPKKYSVVDTEGRLKPGHCIDIVIRHKDVLGGSTYGTRDKFRIQVWDQNHKSMIGRKDVTCTLLPTREASQTQEDCFESLPSSTPERLPHHRFKERDFRTSSSSPTHGPNWLIVSAAVVCIAVLMLPTHGDPGSIIPHYLCLSLPQKLIAAYILGLVTMAILRN